MKHASPTTLKSLTPLLEALRTFPGLTERRPGIFYLRSAAFLHFHEHPAGLFADVKLNQAEFVRLPVNTREHQEELLRQVSRSLESAPVRRRR